MRTRKLTLKSQKTFSV
jgi:hypothetical protein